MKPFAAPLDDILFSLNEIAGADRIADWDGEFAAELGGHFSAFAEGEIAPLDEPGDIQGCRLIDGRVRMPDGFRKTYEAYVEQGWCGLTAPEEYGGQGLGGAMLGITSEIFSGACHSFQMVTGLIPGAVGTLLRFGTKDQQDRMIPPLVKGECLATMCLTESGAGSDLSRIRCKGISEGDSWKIQGEKIFISGGDQDLSKEILHLVLAKTGEKSLSLFLCPSRSRDGERNEITVTRIEEKMGLHASPTCQLVFDGAEAELIGAEGEGLKAMFTMMNHARVDVALQGVAHAARAHDIASSYAADRQQGRKPDGSPALLSDHADVRRMLDEMDGLALGARAMAHCVLVLLETGEAPALVDFMTPLIKVFCTEAGMRSAELGTQVLGGYGYLREYRVEQTYRDARITAIYEGTNGIHASALATRGLRRVEGPDAFEDYIGAIAKSNNSEVLSDALSSWRVSRKTVSEAAEPTNLAHDFMQETSKLLFLAMWIMIGSKSSRAPLPSRYQRLAARILKS